MRGKVFGIAVGVALGLVSAASAANVTLAWNPSVGTNVAGYRIYQGVASGTYTNMVDVGNATNATLTNLVDGTTYFFAATAYDNIGLESIFSNEVSYEPTNIAAASLQIALTPGGGFQLNGLGPAGYQYNVLESFDLTNWSAITNVTLDASGIFQLTFSPGGILGVLGGLLPSGAVPQSGYFKLQQTYPAYFPLTVGLKSGTTPVSKPVSFISAGGNH